MSIFGPSALIDCLSSPRRQAVGPTGLVMDGLLRQHSPRNILIALSLPLNEKRRDQALPEAPNVLISRFVGGVFLPGKTVSIFFIGRHFNTSLMN